MRRQSRVVREAIERGLCEETPRLLGEDVGIQLAKSRRQSDADLDGYDPRRREPVATLEAAHRTLAHLRDFRELLLRETEHLAHLAREGADVAQPPVPRGGFGSLKAFGHGRRIGRVYVSVSAESVNNRRVGL